MLEFQRVHPGEWLVAAAGGLILVGLLIPFSGGESAFGSVGLLDLILLGAAVGGLVLPALLARSRTTDVPITFETYLSTLVTLATLLLLLKVVWPPDGGLDVGFFAALTGCLVMTGAGWKSVSREN